MRILRGFAKVTAVVLLVLIVALAALFGGMQTDAGRRFLAQTIGDVASSPDFGLEIQGIEGLVPFDMTVAQIHVRDGAGRWLTVDGARVAWDPWALLDDAFAVTTLGADRLTVRRVPEATEGEPPSDQPFEMPQLPLAIDLADLTIGEIVLEPPVAGMPVAASLSARARVGHPGEGLDLTIDLQRTDSVPARLMLDAHFNPDDLTLTLEGALEEPPGGLLAAALARPDLPEVRVDLAGAGTLDDWSGRLTASAGDLADIVAAGRIEATADGRRLSVDLAGDVAAFVPPPATEIVGDDLGVSAVVLMRTDGTVEVDDVQVWAAGFEVAATGRADPAAGEGEARIRIAATEPQLLAPIVGPVSWRQATVTLTAGGPFEQPSLAAEIRGSALAYDTYAAEQVLLDLTVQPTGPLTDPESRARVDLRGRIDGPQLGAAEASAMIGDGVDIALSALISLDGSVTGADAMVGIDHATVRVTGDAVAWGAEGTADIQVAVPDLSSLAAALGQPIAGSVALDAAAGWGTGGVAADLAADLDGIVTGIAQADALLAEGATVRAAFEASAAGRLEQADLSLTAGPLNVTATPDLDAEPQAIDWRVSVADLSALVPEVAGRSRIAGRLTDPMGAPGVDFTAELDDVVAAGRAVTDARAGGTLQLDGTAFDAAVEVAATVDGVPVSAEVQANGDDGGAVSIPALAVDLGGLALSGSAELGPDGAVAGRLAGAGRIDALAGLLAAPVQGAVDLSLEAELADQSMQLNGTVTATGLVVPDGRIGRLSLTAAAQGEPAAPLLDLSVRADDLAAGPIAGGTAQIVANGTPNDLAFEAELAGADARAALAGRLGLGEAVAVDLANLRLAYQDLVATLAAPTRITVAGPVVTIDPMRIAVEEGRVDLAGEVGEALALDVTLAGLPLGLARLGAPDLALVGRLDGTVSARGSADQPDIAFDLTVASGGLADAAAGLPTADIDAGGTLRADTLDLSVAVRPSTGGALDVDGVVGLAGGPLDLAITGGIDLDAIPVLAASADRVGGRLDVDLRAGGTLAAPVAGGDATLTAGQFVDAGLGVSFTDISARVVGDQDTIRIAAFSATTPGGGAVTAEGEIGLDPDAGLPLRVAVTAQNAVLLNREEVVADLDLDLAVSGTAAESLDLAGAVAVNRIEITVPDRLPASLPVIDVEEINPPPHVAERLEQERAEQAAAAEAPATPIAVTLDVAVDAPRAVFIRGQGLDIEVGGQLAVRGTANAPRIGGQLALRRGRLDVLGRRFQIEAGTVEFIDDTSMDPLLDFRATTAIDEGTGIISVTGFASDPQFGFSSNPELPEDEVLARILFGRSVGELSPFQAITLAQSVAQLSGVRGTDLLGRVQAATGLAEIDITAPDGADDATLGIGSYLTDNVFIGVDQGLADPTATTGQVEVEITPNISVESDVGIDGSGRIGVNMEWDY